MSAWKQIANEWQLPSERLTPDEIERRILQLHADGLRPRDISSLVGVHPQIVLRLIGAKQ